MEVVLSVDRSGQQKLCYRKERDDVEGSYVIDGIHWYDMRLYLRYEALYDHQVHQDVWWINPPTSLLSGVFYQLFFCQDKL